MAPYKAPWHEQENRGLCMEPACNWNAPRCALNMCSECCTKEHDHATMPSHKRPESRSFKGWLSMGAGTKHVPARVYELPARTTTPNVPVVPVLGKTEREEGLNGFTVLSDNTYVYPARAVDLDKID